MANARPSFLPRSRTERDGQSFSDSSYADTRLKVLLFFQICREGDIVKRKKMFSFRALDSLKRVYEAISGHTGSCPLWPPSVGAKVQEEGVLVYLYVRQEDSSSQWKLCMPQSRLYEIAMDLGKDVNEDFVLSVKLLAEERSAVVDNNRGRENPKSWLAVNYEKAQERRVDRGDFIWSLGTSSFVVRRKQTFLHVDEVTDDS